MKTRIQAWACGALAVLLTVPAIAATPASATSETAPPAIDQLSVGKYHTLAVDEADRVWSWGMNGGIPIPDSNPVQYDMADYGALGNGHLEYGGLYPSRVMYLNAGGEPEPLGGIEKVAAGYGFSVALATDGTVWTWGRNDKGQLGYNTSGTPSAYADSVEGLPGDIVDIAAGEAHVLALTGSGEVYAWGANDFGQLGTSEEAAFLSTPAPVLKTDELPLGGIRNVYAGKAHSLAVTSDNLLYAWGNNQDGEVGTGSMDLTVPAATKVALENVQRVYTGWAAKNTYAVVGASETVADAVYGWGSDSMYQGNGETAVPQEWTALKAINPKDIAVGDGYMLASGAGGDVYGAGTNESNRLSSGYLGTHGSFMPIPTLHGASDLEAGYASSFAMWSDGTWWSWGYNQDAALGTELWWANPISEPTPVRALIDETVDVVLELLTNSGEPVANRTIRLADSGDYGYQFGTTDGNGIVTFKDVMPIEHDIVIQDPGYIPTAFTPIQGQAEPYRLTITEAWEPMNLNMWDRDNVSDQVTGGLSWSDYYLPSIPENQKYEAYFVDEWGMKLPGYEPFVSVMKGDPGRSYESVTVPTEAAGIRLFITRVGEPEWGERPSAWALIVDYPTRSIQYPVFYDSNPAAGIVDGNVTFEAMENETGVAAYEILGEPDFYGHLESSPALARVEATGGGAKHHTLIDAAELVGYDALYLRPVDAFGHHSGSYMQLTVVDSRIGPPPPVAQNGNLDAPHNVRISDESAAPGVSGTLGWGYWIPGLPLPEGAHRITGFHIYSMKQATDGTWSKVQQLAYVPTVGSWLYEGTREMYFTYRFPTSQLADGATHYGVYALDEDEQESIDFGLSEIYPYSPWNHYHEIDANDDNRLDISELVAFGRTGEADFNGDGAVTKEDIRFMLLGMLSPVGVELPH